MPARCPAPPGLIAANEAREAAGITPEFLELLEGSVVDVVQRQKDLGNDIPNDGEYGHTMSSSVDYGAWWNYSFSRLGGLEPTDVDRWADAEVHRSSPGNIVLTSFPDRRDRQKFSEAYNDPSSGVLAHRKSVTQPKIAGPLSYTGHELVGSDIANLKTGLAAAGLTEVSWPLCPRVPAPASPTSTTRPTRNSSTPAPTRCARNTRPSSTPA